MDTNTPTPQAPPVDQTQTSNQSPPPTLSSQSQQNSDQTQGVPNQNLPTTTGVTTAVAQSAQNPNLNPIAAANNKISQTPDVDALNPTTHAKVKQVKGIMDVLGLRTQTKTVINPDGTSTQVEIPRSNRQIGMGLAIAALTGAFRGIGERGPGATGRAASKAFTSGLEDQEKQQEQQNQQAQSDFLRSQATLKANLELRSLALDVGTKDLAFHTNYSKGYEGIVNQLENPLAKPFIVAGSKTAPVSEDVADDIIKHSAFKIDRIPVGDAVPRFDKDGNPAWIDARTKKIVPEGTPGAYPASDNQYILVKHDARIPLSDSNGPTGFIKDIVNDEFAPWIQGANKSLLAGTGASGSIPLATAIQMQNDRSMFHLMQGTLDDYVNTLNGDKKPGDKGYVEPIKLTDALLGKDGRPKIDPDTLQMFMNSAGSTAQPGSTELNTRIDAVTKKNQAAGAKLKALFGNNLLDKYKEDYLAEKAAEAKKENTTPTQTALEEQRLENARKEGQKLDVDIKREKTAADKEEKTEDEIQSAAKYVVGTPGKNDGSLASLAQITSYRNDQKLAVFDAILKEAIAQGKNPQDFSPAALEAKAKLYIDYAEGKTSNNIQSFDAFLGHADDALDATDNMRKKLLAGTGSPILNRPLNWIEKNVSNDPDYATFVTSLEPVRKEFIGFLNAGHAATVEDTHAMSTILSDNSTPAQIESAIKQLGKTSDIRLASIGRKYENTVHQPWPHLVSDEGAKTLARMGIKSQAVALQSQNQSQDQNQNQNQNQNKIDPAKQQIINSITLPGGGHPKDAMRMGDGSIIIWSGKAGDPWTKADGTPVK